MADGARLSNDPLMPGAIAVLAEDVGVKKANQDMVTLFGLAVLGGAFIALGGLFATVTIAGAADFLPYGLTRLLMGVTFSLGLILVVIAGAQLFTSDTLMVMAWASGRLTTRRMLRVWITVWTGNFVGAVGTALLVFLAGHYASGHAEVGSTALYLASSKSKLAPQHAFFLGILCNVLVCLAVWVSMAAQTTSGKILAIQFPITAFVAAGFEHCVANMFFIPYGLLIKWGAPQSFWAAAGIDAAAVDIPLGLFALNLGAVTLGNWVGGTLLVGSVYWVLFRRNQASGAPKQIE
ncbi:MAG TPA: formate/nitrite transporter family protein [Noviherbaspirillum sp.]|uniref:formate/nitrite transporter family protein n=1 Tax=Noviherbaspirillum sp. TaxID=1926288 RepID=UPI002D3CB265|nr:formate/nitrite transporter family protein [Noviherbaspirillum sp.]HYD96144.1 formate/nitrite transporter family protein [Noviherbaspirillum sp.]